MISSARFLLSFNKGCDSLQFRGILGFGLSGRTSSVSGLGRRSSPKPDFQVLLQAEPVAVATQRGPYAGAAATRRGAGPGGPGGSGGAQAVTVPPPPGEQLPRRTARARRGEAVA